jgi:hypothetical protein
MPPATRRSTNKLNRSTRIPPYDHSNKNTGHLYHSMSRPDLLATDSLPHKLNVADALAKNGYVSNHVHSQVVSSAVVNLRLKKFSEPVARLIVAAYLVQRADFSPLQPNQVARMERLLAEIPAAFEANGFPGYNMSHAQDQLDRIMRTSQADGAPDSVEREFVESLSYVERSKHWQAQAAKREEERNARNAVALQQATDAWVAFTQMGPEPAAPADDSDDDSSATVPLQEEASETDYTDPTYESDAESAELDFNIHLNDTKEMVSLCVCVCVCVCVWLL